MNTSDKPVETQVGLRDTLADHFVMWHQMGQGNEPPGEWRCGCGLKFGFSDSAIDHVAEQVRAALRFGEAEKGRLWQQLRDRCERAEAALEAESEEVAANSRPDDCGCGERTCQAWWTGQCPTPTPATECSEGLVRGGEYVPCDRPAVGTRVDPEDGEPYPVCARHLSDPSTRFASSRSGPGRLIRGVHR